MFKSIKFSLIISTVLLSSLSFIVLAEGENTTIISDEATVTAQDLGVSNPNVLPDSPFYFFKEIGRNIQTLFTFNSVVKAQLKEKISNEKLIELQKMVEQNKNQKGIEKAITNYKNGVENVKKVVDKIKENTEQNQAVGNFLDKFVQQQTLHQQILEKLQTQVSTTTFQKIQEAREQHLEKFEQVMNKLENKNTEKIQQRLEQGLEKISTSTKETIIKVRDRIMEKIQQKNTQGTTTGACITLWDPVCGKNGKTYSNSCFATVAGVEIDYAGTCK